MRADAARLVVQQNVEVMNWGANYILQIVPVDKLWESSSNSVVGRAEALRGREVYGDAQNQLAWDLGLGACEEHSTLVARILREAGERVEILRSSAGHAFPVVNRRPGSDPDVPSSWGSEAVVPDSWLGRTVTPEQAWNEGWIFNGGKAFVHSGTETPIRELLPRLLESIRRGNPNDKVRSTYTQLFERASPEIRSELGMPDPADLFGGASESSIERGTMTGGEGNAPVLIAPGSTQPGGPGGHTHGPGGVDIPSSGGGGCPGY